VLLGDSNSDLPEQTTTDRKPESLLGELLKHFRKLRGLV
jgi:hypothetical protein